MVTSADCVEEEVGADGLASAPHSGAAAATPLAGAYLTMLIMGLAGWTNNIC
jgi:hypothetical protein